jgi:hypothetical protein
MVVYSSASRGESAKFVFNGWNPFTTSNLLIKQYYDIIFLERNRYYEEL